MPLSATARADLSEMLGTGYAVVDIKRAPSTANILLTPVVSGQLLGSLRALFPQARILFTELQDLGRGISFAGPLTRIAAHGPDGYFMANALDALTPIVQAEAKLQLTGSTRRTPPRISAAPREAWGDQAADPLHGGPTGPGGGAVIWVDRQATSADPPGLWLDLDPIDELVDRMVSGREPRSDVLWPALVAECAVRLVAHQHENVLVDVSRLTPATFAELQIRVASESVGQLSWPSP